MRHAGRGRGVPSVIADIFINGLVASGAYAILAAGFSLIFGVTKVPNMAHTAFYMIAAYTILVGTSVFGWSLALSILLALVVTMAVGVLAFTTLFDRVKQHEEAVMIISVGLAMLVQEVALQVFGGHARGVPPLLPGFADILGIRVSRQHLLAIVASAAVLVGLWLLLSKTRLGRALRAVSQDREVAGLMGIDVRRVLILAMALSSGLAAVAGVIVAPIHMVSPLMWVQPLSMVLAAVVIGGLGSIAGSVAGALVLGYTETIVSFALPGGSFLRGAVAMSIMIVVLLIRPEGLHGVAFEEERL